MAVKVLCCAAACGLMLCCYLLLDLLSQPRHHMTDRHLALMYHANKDLAMDMSVLDDLTQRLLDLLAPIRARRLAPIGLPRIEHLTADLVAVVAAIPVLRPLRPHIAQIGLRVLP